MTLPPFHGPFGVWLKQRRKALDLTQAQLAQHLHCSRSAIEKLEAHQRKPSRAIAEQLATVLHIPADQTAAFVQWARHAADPVPATPPPSNLHPSPHACLGREQDTTAIRQILRTPTVRLLTLSGVGGVGKTRLARHILALVQADFPDGLWFVDLAPLTRADQVESHIAQTLAIPEVPGQAIHDQLCAAFAQRTMLLVLDNFEHLLDAASILDAYHAAAPNLSILVTSRVPLHRPHEHEYSVPPLAIPPARRTFSLPVLAQYPAIAVFLQFAHAAVPDFALTPESAPTITELCQRLDGLPLALELAAARLRLFSPQTLLARLQQSSNLLSRHVPEQPVRQQTLRGMVEWSYRLLPEHTQQVFIELGVFRGGWTMAAAEAVCTGSDEQPGLVFDTMTLLLEAHLIHADPISTDEPRFTMLETVREFALEELKQRPQYDVVWQRFIKYYESLIDQAKDCFRGPEQGNWIKQLNKDYANIRVIVGALLNYHEPDRAAIIIVNLWRFWYLNGVFNKGLLWLEEILGYKETINKNILSKIYTYAGLFAYSKRNLDLSKEYCTIFLNIAKEVNDQEIMSPTFNILAGIAKDKKQYNDAIELFDQALLIEYKFNNKINISKLLFNKAIIKGILGDVKKP